MPTSSTASNRAPNLTVSDRQHSRTHGDGPLVQRSLRGVLRDALDVEGERIVEAIFLDLAHLTDEEIGERTKLDSAQLSRIRSMKAHPPGRLIAFAIDQGRERHTLRTICAIGEGEFKPKPPPSVEDRHAATLDVLDEMGLGEVVRVRVARKMGAAE